MTTMKTSRSAFTHTGGGPSSSSSRKNQLVLLNLLLLIFSASAEFIPKKSWAVIGYEAFNAEKNTAKKSKQLGPAKSMAVSTPNTKTKSKDSKVTAAPGPGGGTKALIGVGLAALVAVIGGKTLANEGIQPERALVEALTKRVVARPVLVPSPPMAPASLKGSSPDGATIPNEVFNLVKAIVGVGVLSLPAGVAAFGSAPSAFIPAGILIAVIGMLSAYGFSLIGRVCAYTGAKSYREAWSKTVGEGSSWIPAWSTTCKTFLACLAFSMVLADTFSSLLETPRNGTLMAVTVVILLPLCLMKNLKSLAPFSLIGVLGMTYTAVAMTVRFLDGNYAIEGGKEGQFVALLPRHLKPKFGMLGVKSVFSPNALILVCMLSTAYMAHFNAPKFYLELKNNTLSRFNAVVTWSFGISIFLMGFITMIGFLTFGKACDGLVLNNYAGTDLWMGLSRIAVAISLVFSYPLAFTGCRDGFMDLAKVPVGKRSSGLLNLVTIALLGVLTFLACSLTDVSFVLAFGGATLGNLLTYVYPALMYQAVVRQQGRRSEQFGVNVAMASAVLGLGMGIVGATMALRSLD